MCDAAELFFPPQLAEAGRGYRNSGDADARLLRILPLTLPPARPAAPTTGY